MLFARWEGDPYSQKDQGLENIASFSSPSSQFFDTRTDNKPVNDLVVVSTLPVSTHTASRARRYDRGQRYEFPDRGKNR